MKDSLRLFLSIGLLVGKKKSIIQTYFNLLPKLEMLRAAEIVPRNLEPLVPQERALNARPTSESSSRNGKRSKVEKEVESEDENEDEDSIKAKLLLVRSRSYVSKLLTANR